MTLKLIPIAATTLALALALPSYAQDPFGDGAADRAQPTTSKADDPFAAGNPAAPRVFEEPSQETRDDFSLKYEVFSLDLAAAASLIRQDLSDLALYETMVTMVEKNTAAQETLAVVRTRSGQRSKLESNLEYIYPTEWDPAELPNSIGVKIDPPTDAKGNSPGAAPNLEALDQASKLEDLPLFVTPANPTAFETRNLGFTFEFDGLRREDRGLIEAMIAPEHVTLADLATWGQGVSTQQVPEFETQKISTSVLLVVGLPRLIGTINRPPVSKVDPKAKERIWLAFVTASNVK